MSWTRMNDGSYMAVKQNHGRTFTYEARRAYAGRGEKSAVWALYCDGAFVENDRGPDGATLRGVKDRAFAHFARSARC